MIIQIIFYLVFAVLTQIVTYHLLRRIDKKERQFLKDWELEYINAYKDQWRETYFQKLAEEKRMKLVEEQKKKENAALKEKLKQVGITEEFVQQYDDDLQQAIDKLEEEEKQA